MITFAIFTADLQGNLNISITALFNMARFEYTIYAALTSIASKTVAKVIIMSVYDTQ